MKDVVNNYLNYDIVDDTTGMYCIWGICYVLEEPSIWVQRVNGDTKYEILDLDDLKKYNFRLQKCNIV